MPRKIKHDTRAYDVGAGQACDFLLHGGTQVRKAHLPDAASAPKKPVREANSPVLGRHVKRQPLDASKETFDTIVSVLDDTSTLIGNIIKSPIEAAVTVGTTGGKAVYNTSAKGISIAGKIAGKITKPFKKKK